MAQLACGKKHYAVLSKENNLITWGNIFKEKPSVESEGFGLHFGDTLFDGGKVKHLSMKYSIFGALVENSSK